MTNTADLLVLQRELAAPVPAVVWPAGVERVALEAADARAIHGLLQRAYANGFGGVVPDWLDWWETLVADSEFDRDLCVVAKSGRDVIGFCLCWTSSFVKDLVVDPDWQGRRLGAALLAEALATLKARGASAVRLKVRTGNTVAQRLYERMGFAQVS